MKTARTLRIAIPVAFFAILPTLASAALKVGDPVTLNYKTVDNVVVSSEALKGKLVLVDFWATWCGPCMAEAPHMVDVYQKYAPKGLVVLGVSLDQDAATMKPIALQKGLIWPQTVDTTHNLSAMFGINAIPHTILLGPDGVMLWEGHPAGGMDEAIAKAFKEHPPQLVDPNVLREARSSLSEVEKKIEAGDTKAAIKLLGRIPASARADADFAARATDVQGKLEETAKGMLAEAKTQIDGGQYVEAVGRLKELADALTGLPESAKARAMLNSLMSKPEAKAAMAAADRNAKATAALEIAQKLQAQKKDDAAYLRYKDIVKLFAGTDAAATAQTQVAAYEKDPQFVKRVTDNAAATKANAALKMGDSYKAAGAVELARKKYQSVVDDFPGTSYAQTAQKSLDALANQ